MAQFYPYNSVYLCFDQHQQGKGKIDGWLIDGWLIDGWLIEC
ncbi:hypothetical protein [Moorena sp. SIO3I8]|nr:hypothetical protein [Moorena sp. SIO3I8]